MPLLEREHRVVAMDMRGFGGAEKPGSGYSMRTRRRSSTKRCRGSGSTTRPSSGTRWAAPSRPRSAKIPGSPVDALVDIDQAPNNDDDYEKRACPSPPSWPSLP